MRLDVALIEFSDEGGACLVARTSDPEVVAWVRDRLAEQRLADLKRIRGTRSDPEGRSPLRLVGRQRPGPSDAE